MPFASKAIRDRARKRVAQRVRAGEACCFCGRPISLALRYPHPEAFVVDHRRPSSLGGSDHYDDDQLRPAHNQCNRARSNSPDGTVGRNSGALG
jgi:5-methylcytosine-specific restriction endonuclease McrA